MQQQEDSPKSLMRYKDLIHLLQFESTRRNLYIYCNLKPRNMIYTFTEIWIVWFQFVQSDWKEKIPHKYYIFPSIK